MKRLLIMMLALTLWLTSITGATLSYFTAQSDSMATPFTVGTVEVEAMQPELTMAADSWCPGNAQPIAWTFRNVGTNDAYIRARINTQWTTLVEGEALVTAGDDMSPNPLWLQGDPLWRRGADGQWYYSSLVRPGQSVALAFTVSLDLYEPAPLGANYLIGLTVEAIQAISNIGDMWPHNPWTP